MLHALCQWDVLFQEYNNISIHCMEKLFNLLECGLREKYAAQMITRKYPNASEEFSLSPAMNMPQVYHKKTEI